MNERAVLKRGVERRLKAGVVAYNGKQVRGRNRTSPWRPCITTLFGIFTRTYSTAKIDTIWIGFGLLYPFPIYLARLNLYTTTRLHLKKKKIPQQRIMGIRRVDEKP